MFGLVDTVLCACAARRPLGTGVYRLREVAEIAEIRMHPGALSVLYLLLPIDTGEQYKNIEKYSIPVKN